MRSRDFAPPRKQAEERAEEGPDPLTTFWQEQRAEIGDIKVAKTLANAHPIIAGWIKDDEQQRKNSARWGGALADLYRTSALDRRRMRILSALYKALEARGVTVHCQRHSRSPELRHANLVVAFDIKEHIKQQRRPLNEEEIASGWGAHNKYRVDQIPTGHFAARSTRTCPAGFRRHGPRRRTRRSKPCSARSPPQSSQPSPRRRSIARSAKPPSAGKAPRRSREG